MRPTREHLNKYHNFLLKLTLFKNLDGDELSNLFAAMRVQYYQKGEMVAFDTNEHSNLYINYQGLFKLTKIDARGDEIVLRVIDRMATVSPMYFSPNYDICADFVKNTTVLYFSEVAVAELMRHNHQFSLNIIRFLADSVQALMLSTEVLQLKTAKEKVSWYLAHSKINNTAQLPYSKSLTAAYLGMKPESFSRALSELKKEGVVVDDRKSRVKKPVS